VRIDPASKVARPSAGACFIADQILASTIRVSISDSITESVRLFSFVKRLPYRSIGPLWR